MEICTQCRAAIRDKDVIWRTRQTCKQTMSSPAEHEQFPLCQTCDDTADEREAHDEEQRSLRRASDEELERF